MRRATKNATAVRKSKAKRKASSAKRLTSKKPVLSAPSSAKARLPDNVEFHEGPAPSRGRVVFAEALASDLGLKYAYMLKVLGAIQLVMPLTAAQERQIEAALDEGIQNGVLWGNQGDPSKRILLWAWIEDGAWGITLSDQGKGFSPSVLPDYGSPDFPWQERGRGILRLSSELAEVHYYDGGRTLLVRG